MTNNKETLKNKIMSSNNSGNFIILEYIDA